MPPTLPSFAQNLMSRGQLDDGPRTRSRRLFCATRKRGPTWAGPGMLGRVVRKGKLPNDAGRIDAPAG